MCRSHTHTHSGICHLFVSNFIYFLRIFDTLRFMRGGVKGRCSLCVSVCVCCSGRERTIWTRVGDVFAER